jgi:hypothetical protein
MQGYSITMVEMVTGLFGSKILAVRQSQRKGTDGKKCMFLPSKHTVHVYLRSVYTNNERHRATKVELILSVWLPHVNRPLN